VLSAITSRTRVVFLTSPNNPTGVLTPLPAIREVARALPPGAVVFVDEAYFEFCGQTFVPELAAFPNVVVGRTFSKAFGLAGIRIGAITGHPDALEPIRLAVPVYSVNIAAVAAVQAALADRAHLRNYLAQVEQSKALVYAACDRLGLQYWKSAANFVLVRAGDRLDAILDTAVAHKIYLRDRSSEPGCEGCLRVATGVVEHTRRFIDVLEEVLCAAP
jgi:histidinol-phosphate aminotransferase